MIKKLSGFTLIELVIVIIIMGVLAGIAIPRYINLQSQARTNAAKAAANGLTSATLINYMALETGNTSKVVTVSGCATALDTLTNATEVSNNYTVAGGDFPGTAVDGDTMTCTLKSKVGSAVGTATIYRATKP